MFQSTRPQGARPDAVKSQSISWRFNPRARKGRDLLHQKRCKIQGVSIHAPARGATGLGWTKSRSNGFQSTRPQGARPARRTAAAAANGFNPRARKGRDDRDILPALQFAVSIHAPARGATNFTARVCPIDRFQSTRPQGARPSGMHLAARIMEFQSTRPQGARLASCGS